LPANSDRQPVANPIGMYYTYIIYTLLFLVSFATAEQGLLNGNTCFYPLNRETGLVIKNTDFIRMKRTWNLEENNYLQGGQGGTEYIETTIYSPTAMTYGVTNFAETKS
jgi:hypothetical protein